MNNAIVKRESQPVDIYQPQTPQQILEQVSLIQQVMKTAMREGEHYGKIPGCGEKSTLLKPGAEKLLFLFRLGTKLNVVERELANGHREYQVTVTIFRQADGADVGQGVGSCSTLEAKYKYRAENTNKPVPQEYWTTRNQQLLGGPSFVRRKVKGQWMIFHQVEHDNPADYYNTVLKMAKKRAQVDATLTATAASDCFTQDIEDIQENLKVYTGDDDGVDVTEAEVVHRQEPATKSNPVETSKAESSTAGPASDWRSIVIHFGKNKGASLGSLRSDSLEWYIKEWNPKPWPEGSNNYKEADLALRKALNAAEKAMNGEADEVPV